MNPRVCAALSYSSWFLVVVSTVAWRQGVYYEGGADKVVLAKAACQAAACLLALAAAVNAGATRRIAGHPFLLLMLFVAISLIGAVTSGDVPASLVLAVRVVLAAVTVGLLLMATPGSGGVKPLLVMMALVGLVSAATGLGSFLAGQRLTGDFPPLQANAIAGLCGVPAIAAAHAMLRGRGNLVLALALTVLVGAVVATESRTALLGLALAIAAIAAALRKVERAVVVSVLVAAAVALPALLYTPALMNLIMRPGSAPLLTLNSRTLAWETVLETPSETWERWVGAGLSIKTVAVKGQYWETQVLDSSWISALAQAGVLGTMVLGAWAVALLLRTLRVAVNTPLPAILLFVLLRSFLENGLTEASTSFLIFFAVSLMVWEPHPGAAPRLIAAPGRIDFVPAIRQPVKAPR